MQDVAERNQFIAAIVERILKSLGLVESAARAELGQRQLVRDANAVVATPDNQMANGNHRSAGMSVVAAQDGARAILQSLLHSPFVARIVAENEKGEPRVMYIARRSP